MNKITVSGVVKRDGRVVSFDFTRMTKAIAKALEATGTSVEELKNSDTGQHLDNELSRHLNEFLLEECTVGVATVGPVQVTVEQLQDICEQTLMSCGYHKAARAFVLYREERAKARKMNQAPPTEALAGYIHASKYARWVPQLGRRETFDETVQRVQDMHTEKYPDLATDITWAFEFVRKHMVLPSMRSMQFAGRAIGQRHERMYNCSFTHLDRTRAFAEALYLLLCGCGVGFSCQRQHVAKLPQLQSIDRSRVHHHSIGDSIEGWAEAIKNLFDAYVEGYYIEFDYSKIRPQGAELKTTGGKAPGHLPLKAAIENVRGVLDQAVGRHLRPIECHDIMCFLAECVLAGGIRRSSLISLFSWDDEEMMMAKHPTNFAFGGKNKQREMANNSAVVKRDWLENEGEIDGSLGQFADLVRQAAEHWEPGFFLTDNLDHGTNPCGEIGLDPTKNTGEVGFAFCNLTEINMAACKTVAEALQAAEAASIIGTLQAGYTKFPYLGRVTEEIARRDALLGVSMTGMADNPSVAFDPGVQRAMAEIVVQTNKRVATKLGLNTAARCTCVKPSGTASLELGGVASGIHPHHAPVYLRRVVANRLEPVAQFFAQKNPAWVRDKSDRDMVIDFPCKAPKDAICVKQTDPVEFIEKIASTYENWVKPGTTRGSLTHNVSCTVAIDVIKNGEWNEHEWRRIWAGIKKPLLQVQAMSFAPMYGDRGEFMPRMEVRTPEDKARYQELLDSYTPVNWAEFREQTDETKLRDQAACEGDKCEIPVG